MLRTDFPQTQFRFDLSGEEIELLINHLIAEDKRLTDELVKIEHKTVENFYLPMLDSELGISYYSTAFLADVTTSESVRTAGYGAKEALSQYGVEKSMRVDVFNGLVEAAKTPLPLTSIDPMMDDNQIEGPHPIHEINLEINRLIELDLKAMRLSGLEKDQQTRERIQAVKAELSELKVQFSKTVNTATPKLWVDPKELRGTPPTVISRLEKDEETGKVAIVKDYPVVVPLSKYCEISNTRHQTSLMRNKLGGEENLERLRRAVQLRARLANLLGYDTYAPLRLAMRMEKDSKVIKKFVDDMVKSVEGFRDREITYLRELAAELPSEAVTPTEKEGLITSWDINYLKTLGEKRLINYSEEETRPYFETNSTLTAIMELLGGFLGLEFSLEKGIPVEPRSEGNPRTITELKRAVYEEGTVTKDKQTGKLLINTWHPEVFVYSVRDARSGAKSSDEPIGYLFCDLFPRENKYGHACCHSVQAPLYRTENGVERCVRPGVTALICNFEPPSDDKPSLISHGEVETLLHELGHGMHALCSHTAFDDASSLEGVENDFIECPSQAQEEWCYLPSFLRHFRHYETKEVMPQALIDAIVKSRRSFTGCDTVRQLFFAGFDLKLHTISEENAENLSNEGLREDWNATQEVVCRTLPAEEGCMLSNFAHLMGGYEAGYYTYFYTKAITADLFEGFAGERLAELEKEGKDLSKLSMRQYGELFDGGIRFRDILLSGARKPMNEALVEFLGREWNTKAILKQLEPLKELK